MEFNLEFETAAMLLKISKFPDNADNLEISNLGEVGNSEFQFSKESGNLEFEKLNI